MSESAKYEAYKKKLQGVCDENNLVFRFRGDKYPITLTISPVTGLAEQLSLLEEDDEEEEVYRSPDAVIMFTHKDGVLTYRMDETFTISDALFSKIKNLYKNMHSLWLQFFFRDIIEKGALNEHSLPRIADEHSPDEHDDPDAVDALANDVELESEDDEC